MKKNNKILQIYASSDFIFLQRLGKTKTGLSVNSGDVKKIELNLSNIELGLMVYNMLMMPEITINHPTSHQEWRLICEPILTEVGVKKWKSLEDNFKNIHCQLDSQSLLTLTQIKFSGGQIIGKGKSFIFRIEEYYKIGETIKNIVKEEEL